MHATEIGAARRELYLNAAKCCYWTIMNLVYIAQLDPALHKSFEFDLVPEGGLKDEFRQLGESFESLSAKAGLTCDAVIGKCQAAAKETES